MVGLWWKFRNGKLYFVFALNDHKYGVEMSYNAPNSQSNWCQEWNTIRIINKYNNCDKQCTQLNCMMKLKTEPTNWNKSNLSTGRKVLTADGYMTCGWKNTKRFIHALWASKTGNYWNSNCCRSYGNSNACNFPTIDWCMVVKRSLCVTRKKKNEWCRFE